MDLLIVSCFAAFFLAVAEQIADLKIFKALLALVFSIAGAALVETSTIPKFIALSVASAFLSSFLVALAARITLIPASVTRQVGPRE